MGNEKSGSPLLQMMAYARIRRKQDNLSSPRIDVSMLELFIEKGAVLSRVLTAGSCNMSTALEMAISLQRFDIVKLLIDAGVDPILCGDGEISPLLFEYNLFGTHNFIRWLLNEHLRQHQIPAFVDHLLSTGVIFRNLEASFKGCPVHALLLCGHKETIHDLVQKKPELLEKCDSFGRTALHVAAEEGDLISVKILLEW